MFSWLINLANIANLNSLAGLVAKIKQQQPLRPLLLLRLHLVSQPRRPVLLKDGLADALMTTLRQPPLLWKHMPTGGRQ